MLYTKSVRMTMYIVTLVLFSSFGVLCWLNTTPRDGGSLA
jgi:hypothetical protein